MRHIKVHIFWMIGVVLAAIGIVVILSWVAMKPINKKNGFQRTFINQRASILNKTINEDIVDFAGYNAGSIYFKTKDPSKILSTDYHLYDKKYMSIHIPSNKKINSRFITLVDSTSINILAGNLPAIISVKDGKEPFKIYNFPSKLFIRAIQLSPNSYVFRGFDSSVKSADPIFFKGNPITKAIQRELNISEKNNDAGISTDGALLYDKKSNLIVYTFFYNNDYLCLDTNLNLIAKRKTIDTFSIKQATAGEVQSKGIITNLKPKRLINAMSCVADGLLFNNSMIKADNEDLSKYSDESVVDIYNIKTGSYNGSIYIPKINGERMTKFQVINNLMYVIYKSNIVVYTISLQ